MAITAFYFLIFVVYTYALETKSGPYNLKIVNVTNCGGDGPDQMQFDLKSKSYNESSDIIDGTVKLPLGYPDDMQLKIYVDEWRNGAWLDKVYFFKLNRMCSDVKGMLSDETFTQIKQHLKIDEKCPIRAGTYVYKDFLITPNLIAPKETKYATYRVRFEACKGDKPTGCAEIVFQVTPKVN